MRKASFSKSNSLYTAMRMHGIQLSSEGNIPPTPLTPCFCPLFYSMKVNNTPFMVPLHLAWNLKANTCSLHNTAFCYGLLGSCLYCFHIKCIHDGLEFQTIQVFYFVLLGTTTTTQQRATKLLSVRRQKTMPFSCCTSNMCHLSNLTASTEKLTSTQDIFIQTEHILSRITHQPNISRSFHRQVPISTDDS